MSASTWVDAKGRQTTVYRCYSFESVCALFEQRVRGLMPKWKPIKIWVPQLAIGGEVSNMPSPFMFAVALDTSGESLAAGTSTVTLSFTCTGSNLILFSERGVDNPLTSSQTYNSVSMTAIAADQSTQGGVTLEALDYLVAPATGANNLVLTASGSSGGKSIDAASYSGVAQNAPATTNTLTPSNAASPLSISITTSVTDSWLVLGFGISGTASAGTNSVIRQQEASYHGAGIADSNSAQGAPGSKTMTLTYGGILWQNGMIAEIAPAPTTFIKTFNGLTKASIKTINGVAIASVKTINGVS